MKGKNMATEKKKSTVYLILAIVVALLTIAGVITAIIISNNNNSHIPVDIVDDIIEVPENPPVDEPPIEEPNKEPAEPTVSVIKFIPPIEDATVTNTHGFYHNQTLNWYYLHTGIDFSAPAGTQLKSAYAGTVESITVDDVLLVSQIVIDHGEGLKTVYAFVEPVATLKVGDSVAQGQVIARVAEASGDEYLDGAHLHFEVIKNSEYIDPEIYLDITEK